ncbi:PilN domain-containing protein [Limnohabitans sp.]|uniref:PilN domain-containing protein n=1 Tax=Limnohabitans sp. TaxID=1907725 RepID=UPI0025BF5371|nr:PilN domain-containing protein [Limnohabitans sp.]
MKSLNLSPTLFGIDLRQLGQDWSRALMLMAQWPGVRWLTPHYATRLRQPQGGQIICIEKNGQTQVLPTTQETPFEGLVLPEDKVLWSQLSLPGLQGDARHAAVQMEVDRLNPFPPEELLWTYHTQTLNGVQKVQIAITSSRLVAEQIVNDSAARQLRGQKPAVNAPEVWAQEPSTGQYILFAGFGETIRWQRTRQWRTINLLLVLLIVLVGLAAAVTPSLQLRSRVQQAHSSFVGLQDKAAAAVAAREQMTKLNNKVQQLQALAGKRMVPEHVLLLLTKYIPDDTYILVLDIKQSTINITGITPNATALMQHLGKQPGVTKVTAPNAARRERDKEVFNIEFILTPPATETAAAASTATATPAPAGVPALPAASAAPQAATKSGAKP